MGVTKNTRHKIGENNQEFKSLFKKTSDLDIDYHRQWISTSKGLIRKMIDWLNRLRHGSNNTRASFGGRPVTFAVLAQTMPSTCNHPMHSMSSSAPCVHSWIQLSYSLQWQRMSSRVIKTSRILEVSAWENAKLERLFDCKYTSRGNCQMLPDERIVLFTKSHEKVENFLNFYSLYKCTFLLKSNYLKSVLRFRNFCTIFKKCNMHSTIRE